MKTCQHHPHKHLTLKLYCALRRLGDEGSATRLRTVASVDTFEECATTRDDTVGRMAQRALLARGDSAMQGLDKQALAQEQLMARFST